MIQLATVAFNEKNAGNIKKWTGVEPVIARTRPKVVCRIGG